ADHRRHAARGKDGTGREGEVPQSRLGRDRLGIRLAPYAIRDVLRRRAFRHQWTQLSYLRLGRRHRTGRRPDAFLPSRRRIEPKGELTAHLSRQPMKVAIVNLGQIVSGNWREPFASGDTIMVDGDKIASVGTASVGAVNAADVV